MKAEALEYLQKLKSEKTWGTALWGEAIRPLTQAELETLTRQGNRCEDWTLVTVCLDFRTELISGNRFRGKVVLGKFEKGAGIFDSWIEDSEIGDAVLIERGVSLQKAVVCPFSRVASSQITCSSWTSFGIGTNIKAGLEISGKVIPIHEKLDLFAAQALLTSQDGKLESLRRAELWRWEYSVVGERCHISNSTVDRAFLGSFVAVVNRSTVENSCALAQEDEPVTISDGALVRNCVIQPGVSISTGAQVVDSIFLEHSGAERNALVTASLIGPNSHIGAGEVSACFLGPFVGLHHQSLLISAWWPEGRGNLGYGANVGSNHTSRAPDQEIYPGEGTFFGLGCVVKFPSNFQDAPYSLVSSGITTLPQKLSLPFSLILEEQNENPKTKGLNRIVPAWMLSDNVYSLLRNEEKFKQRNHARRHSFDFRIARPELVDKVWNARESLAGTSGKAVYLKADIPTLGKNFLLEEDRVRALKAYDDFLLYATLKIAFDDSWGEISCSADWLDAALDRCGYRQKNWDLRGEKLIELEARYLETATASRQKDEQRGQETIPEYRRFHTAFEEDEFLKKRQISLETLQKRIRKIHEKKT